MSKERELVFPTNVKETRMPRTAIGFYIEFGNSFTGGPRNLYNLVRELNREHFEPVVITNKPSPLVDALREIDIEPIILELPPAIGADDGLAVRGGIGKKLAAWRELRKFNRRVQKVFEERDVRLLWVRNIKGVLLTGAACRRINIPLIWDIGMEKTSEGFMWVLHLIGFWTASRVVTEGEVVARSIFTPWQLARFSRKIIANPTGVPEDRVAQVRRESMPGEPPWNPFTVLNVATINPRKNQMMLARAAAELVSRYPSLVIRIVGPATDISYEEELKEFIRAHNLQSHIELVGWSDQVAEYLHASQLFALCSNVEGVPQSVLEAMHAHVPVLATAAGGVPDVVSDGKTGYLVPVGDQESFTQKLAYCLEHQEELRRLAANAQKLLDTEFNAKAWYARYERLFAQLLG